MTHGEQRARGSRARLGRSPTTSTATRAMPGARIRSRASTHLSAMDRSSVWERGQEIGIAWQSWPFRVWQFSNVCALGATRDGQIAGRPFASHCADLHTHCLASRRRSCRVLFHSPGFGTGAALQPPAVRGQSCVGSSTPPQSGVDLARSQAARRADAEPLRPSVQRLGHPLEGEALPRGPRAAARMPGVGLPPPFRGRSGGSAAWQLRLWHGRAPQPSQMQRSGTLPAC